MLHFLAFGTHPRLSLAEYKSLRPGVSAPRTVSSFAIVDDPDWNGEAFMTRLGGTVKLGDIVESIPGEELDEEKLAGILVPRTPSSPRSLDFGLTVVGGSPGLRKKLERLPIALKRALAKRDVRSRWVTGPDKSPLSPAAVAKVGLIDMGSDLVLIAESGGIVNIGRTTHVQDADAWSERDYGRPIRDDRAGMLPPKLARIMTNLARVSPGETVFDPFCGNGTILMEAALAADAKEIIGSDIDPKQTESAERNTAWLAERGIISSDDAAHTKIFTADARDLKMEVPPASVDVIISEGALGPPLRGGESQAQLDKTKETISRLWIETLQNLRPLLKDGARLVIIWPSFKTDRGMSRVELDREVEGLGYKIVNPLEGWDDSGNVLLYHRQGQRVARRIVVLKSR